MPRPIPVEFRRRAVALVGAGKPITIAAVEFGVRRTAIQKWVRQDQIDRGERPGITTLENMELSKAKKRIRQLEEEVKILKQALNLFGEDKPSPKEFTYMLTRSSRQVIGLSSVAVYLE